ncbi:AarF/ABC1/UbiB kinase family protein [Roseomonas sp. 18066]|uniref:ABC1 kinase family protein n=1 Tax=Roseomonas sp. 18066 TaxID=2681412 RepID=UPI001357D52A|nr:AarF/ABC1/UbiB kinase family protein [Roseomonas sp. 18066]
METDRDAVPPKDGPGEPPPPRRRRMRLWRPQEGRLAEATPIKTSALSEHLRPSDLVPLTSSAGLAFAAPPQVGRLATLRIARTLLGYLGRVAFARVIGKYEAARAARELREIFERLGGLWVKMGQLIALRSDVLDPRFCEEMNRLQYSAIGFPPEESMRIIREELGEGRVEELFETLSPVPFAAASISQVHLGRLRHPNVDVIVKVQRPGVREVFERDFAVLRGFVAVARLIPKVRALRLEDALDELRRIIAEETDFRFEAANMRRMRKLLRDDKVLIPRVFREASTARILVSECVWGVMMADYIRVRATDPERVRAWCAENDVEPEEVGERLFSSYMRQLMEENFFHADLHPGNIILLRNGRFALIDLGSVGSVDRQFLGIYQGMLRALGNQDFAKAADLLLRICSNVRAGDVPQLRAELVRSYRDWAAKVHIDGLPYHERNVLSGSNAAGAVLARYGVAQSWDLMKLGRAWATMDASLNELFPDMNYIRLFRAYFAEASGRRLRGLLRPRTIRDGLGNLIAQVSDYNMAVGQIVRNQAIVLQATASKVSRIGVILARGLKLGAAIGMAMVGMTYLQQHHPALADDLGLESLNPLGTLPLPLISPLWWGFLFVMGFLTLRALIRVQRELSRRD